MSRSYKKTPIIGNCSKGCSEKKDKNILHGRIRARARRLLQTDPENYLDPLPEEAYNVWSMTKDGKHYFGDWKSSPYRTEDDVKKYMRK